MRSILFLLPDLDYHGRTRQATSLAAALPRERFTVRCFSRGGAGPFADLMRSAKVIVEGVGHRVFDLENIVAIRRLLSDNPPSAIHVWGRAGLSLLAWATWLKPTILPPLIVTLSNQDLFRLHLKSSERRLLSRASLVVSGETDRQSAINAKLPAGSIQVIRPGVPIPEARSDRTALGLSADGFTLAAVGHWNENARFHDALWAYDNLHGMDDSVQLMLIGDGRFQERILGKFYYASRGAGVHRLGSRTDAPALISLADVVFIDRPKTGGLYSLLEAMAAGRAVVSSDLPHLRECIREGETGLLFEPGRIASASRHAQALVKDRDLARQLGESARSEVQARFRVDEMTAAYAQLYDEVAR